MKILIISLIITLFLVSGCSKTETTTETEEIKEVIETSEEPENLCENIDIDYQVSNIETKIEPRPNESDHQQEAH